MEEMLSGTEAVARLLAELREAIEATYAEGNGRHYALYYAHQVGVELSRATAL